MLTTSNNQDETKINEEIAEEIQWPAHIDVDKSFDKAVKNLAVAFMFDRTRRNVSKDGTSPYATVKTPKERLLRFSWDPYLSEEEDT
jgi:hypothetical protein